MFETSYAYRAAEKGCAIIFPMDKKSGGEEVEGVTYEETRPLEIDLSDTKSV